MDIVKAVAIADLHAPFTHLNLFENFLAFCKSYKPKVIFILGDLLDCYSMSKFCNAPSRASDFAYERTIARELLLKLRKTNSNAKIIYVAGNHDQRLGKFLSRGQNATLYNLEELKLPAILDLQKYAIDYHDYMYRLPSGFVLTHGSRCGLNPAQGEALSYLSSGMSGHCHKWVEFHRSFLDKKLDWYSIPCMCDITQLEYAQTFRHQWDMGFATIEYTETRQDVKIYLANAEGGVEW